MFSESLGKEVPIMFDNLVVEPGSRADGDMGTSSAWPVGDPPGVVPVETLVRLTLVSLPARATSRLSAVTIASWLTIIFPTACIERGWRTCKSRREDDSARPECDRFILRSI